VNARSPNLACCNFIPGVGELKQFALEHGFAGIDWSFYRDDLPPNAAAEAELGAAISGLQPLEIRYHCAFERTDLGDEDPEKAKEAMRIFRRVCRLVSKLEGRILTIHVGLGLDSTLDLSWERTVDALGHLVRFADGLGVRLCLENLAWGWTSRPNLFEKLIRKSGAWATLDIGHARVSPSVATQHYTVEDFVGPQPGRVLNAHIYHEEDEAGHIPPDNCRDLEHRLRILAGLPACDWWVLELRQRHPLLQTLALVRQFLATGGCPD
jgi:hypothetical protein